MIVLDTNVVSEALKPQPSGSVLDWLAAQEPSYVFVTAITQAEILYGVAILPSGKRRQRLLTAVGQMFAEDFENRILPFDEAAANAFAEIFAARDAAGRPISQFDAMTAAIARRHSAAVATRNIADFEHCGIRILNPWAK